MASAGAGRRGIEELPDEIFLAILAYLDETTLTVLQLVSKSFRAICRDDRLWKSRCFDESTYYGNFLARLSLLQYQLERANATSKQHSNPSTDVAVTITSLPAAHTPTLDSTAYVKTQSLSHRLEGIRATSKTQLRANWDPSYPGETVSWYSEFIQRYGPVTTNWFQSPRRNGATNNLLNEVRGLALYTPGSVQREPGAEPLFAVSPLEDGTVCLFDVNGSRVRRGAVLGKSAPGMLFSYGHDPVNARRENRINSVTECVSVDSQSNRAFFAVQSHLVEVDLKRLDVVSQQSFEWSVTTLSEATPGVPLTVGTSLGLHLYDHRAPRTHSPTHDEKIDLFSRIFSNDPLPAYAPLSQPTPLCIHHLPEAGDQDTVSNDMYIAGRFPSILWYDRRQWPHILGSIHSGARLVSLASLPYPLASDVQRRKWGEVPQERILESKSVKGQTLIAAGEYETKGSLELVGLRSQQNGGSFAEGGARRRKPWGYDKGSLLQNRQSASNAKVFSAITHGTRIALSDGGGFVKWFERDGFTEVRRHSIGSPENQGPSQPSMFLPTAETGDFARKLVSTRTRPAGCGEAANNDDIVFWTGERLGMITFSGREGFKTGDFEAEESKDAEVEEEVEKYSGMMKRALEVHADEVRLTRNLVLGGP